MKIRDDNEVVLPVSLVACSFARPATVKPRSSNNVTIIIWELPLFSTLIHKDPHYTHAESVSDNCVSTHSW